MSLDDGRRSPGHSVLAVPVKIAPIEAYVRARTAFYDASFLSRDPAFAHAHITVLAPFVASPTERELAKVGRALEGASPFALTLEDIEEFPNGVIHLRPEPIARFRDLTARIRAAFPDHPPYGGLFGDVAPHLTLERRSEDVSLASVRAELAPHLPARAEVTRLELQWWANDDCHLKHHWTLGEKTR